VKKSQLVEGISQERDPKIAKLRDFDIKIRSKVGRFIHYWKGCEDLARKMCRLDKRAHLPL
jgi:hypothetical protein